MANIADYYDKGFHSQSLSFTAQMLFNGHNVHDPWFFSHKQLKSIFAEHV